MTADVAIPYPLSILIIQSYGFLNLLRIARTASANLFFLLNFAIHHLRA